MNSGCVHRSTTGPVSILQFSVFQMLVSNSFSSSFKKNIIFVSSQTYPENSSKGRNQSNHRLYEHGIWYIYLIPWLLLIIIIIMIIIMSLTPVSSSNKDIRGVPSMQSSYSSWDSRTVGLKLATCFITSACQILQGNDGYLIVEGKFLIKGKYLLLAGLELGRQTFWHFKECSETSAQSNLANKPSSLSTLDSNTISY